MLKKYPVVVIMDESQNLLQHFIWNSSRGGDKYPLGYGILKQLSYFSIKHFTLGTNLKLKSFSHFHSKVGSDATSFFSFVTNFPFLGITESHTMENVTYIPNGSVIYLKHFLNLKEGSYKEIAELVAGRPRFTSTLVGFVAKNSETCKSDADVLRIAEEFFTQQTTSMESCDTSSLYHSWRSSFNALSKVTDTRGLKTGIAICLQLMQNFIFPKPSSTIYDYLEEFDVVSHGVALVAKDSSSACIVERMSLIAGINYFMQEKPDYLMENLHNSYITCRDQAGKGNLLESIVALSLLQDPNSLMRFIPNNPIQLPNPPRYIRNNVAITPSLLDSANSTNLCLVLPEQTAGPDILMYDGKHLILITLKTTQSEKLAADATRKNQQRNAPDNLYTILSNDGKTITYYHPSDSSGRKHGDIRKYLQLKNPKVMRVCLDYPLGAPSEKWPSGARAVANGWNICINQTNIHTIVGTKFAGVMQQQSTNSK
jgi:hypothetical protein